MDCLTAQGLISGAVDREVVDAALLAEAKQHCLGCETCSVFVRTLLIARNVPAPTPPADLADRVMLAIRAERDRDLKAAEEAAAVAAATAAAAAAAAASPDASAPGELGQSPDPAPPKTSPVIALRAWANGLPRHELVAWMSAAAVFVAVIGMGTIAGIRVLTTPPAAMKTASAPTAAPSAAAGSLSGAAPESADMAASVAPTATAGSYVTIQGVVFVLNGPSTTATASLTAAGTVTTSLGTGASPVAHPVYTSSDPDRAYVTDDSQQLLAFDRVKRTYAGRDYQLMSAELSAFGVWPVLPGSISAPTAADGSPTFAPLPADSSGAAIYKLSGGDAQTGIAVGPGTSASDPAAGNPNWTWWVPIP